MSLPAGTTIASVSLIVRDLDSVSRFYVDALGFRVKRSEKEKTLLGAENGPAFLELIGVQNARPRPANAPGLFHTAFLFGSRGELSHALQNLIGKGVPIQGGADHGVSEAVYLADPEGNGIELYADRPRDQWPFRNGQLDMVTEPLDLQGLLATSGTYEATGTGPRIGHVHLQVSSLPAAREFWVDRIGFDVMQGLFPGALFVSAGGYHHHLGLNTWRTRGRVLPEGMWTGLRAMTMTVPEAEALSQLKKSLAAESDGPEEDIRSVFETIEVSFVHSSVLSIPPHLKQGAV